MDAIVQSSDKNQAGKNLLNKVVFGKNYSSKNGPKLPPDGPQSNPSQRPYPYPVYERYDGYTVPHPNNMPPPHHHHHQHPHHPYGTNHYANPYGTYPESDMGPYGSHNPYDQGPYSAMHDPYNPHHNPNNMYENYSGYPYGGVTYPGQPRDPGYPTHGIHGGRPIYPPYGSAIHGKTTSPVSTTATRTSNDKNRSGTPVNQINQDNRYNSSSPQENNIYLKNSNALATDNKQFHEDSQNTNEFGPPHHQTESGQSFATIKGVSKVGKCLVCREGDISMALVPCGHNLFCEDCAERITQGNKKNVSANPVCPECFEPVNMAIKIKMS